MMNIEPMSLPKRDINLKINVSAFEVLKNKFEFLMTLVSRVKELPHVKVTDISYITDSGEVVLIPGPWAIERDEAKDEDRDEDNESTDTASTDSNKFVVRNEFGHARLQYLVEKLETLDAYPDPEESSIQVNEVGGHCVVSQEIFQLAISKGWGMKHPFAGRYHPIAGNVIPETTMLFFTPRNSDELEVVWKLVLSSYIYVSQDSD